MWFTAYFNCREEPFADDSVQIYGCFDAGGCAHASKCTNAHFCMLRYGQSSRWKIHIKPLHACFGICASAGELYLHTQVVLAETFSSTLAFSLTQKVIDRQWTKEYNLSQTMKRQAVVQSLRISAGKCDSFSHKVKSCFSRFSVSVPQAVCTRYWHFCTTNACMCSALPFSPVRKAEKLRLMTEIKIRTSCQPRSKCLFH